LRNYPYLCLIEINKTYIMSKKSKKASKEKNLQAKRARRAANKARYQKMRESGQNSKSKRAVSRGKVTKKAGGVSHPEGHCGNHACNRCFPNKKDMGVTPYSKFTDARKEYVL
jgi:hypothetical protein